MRSRRRHSTRNALALLILLPLASAGGCEGAADDDDGAGGDGDGDGYAADQGDCDDADPRIHPGAVEICGDDLDSDCSGDPDDGTTDADGDGAVDDACTGGTDFDDDDPHAHAGALEYCDGVDNDGDGAIDEDTVQVTAGGGGDFATIQEAIDGVDDGATICVGPGTYAENLRFVGRRVRVQGTDGPEATVLDGRCQGSTVRFLATDRSALTGFTVTGGCGELIDPDGNGRYLRYGGGVQVDDAEPLIEECVIVGNEADQGGALFFNGAAGRLRDVRIAGHAVSDKGGAIRARYSGDIALVDVTVEDNTAEATGGGLSLFHTTVTMIRCDVHGNACKGGGGGLYAGTGSASVLRDSSFSGNASGAEGGAIRLYKGAMALDGVTVTGNVAVEGGGVHCRLGELTVDGGDLQGNLRGDLECSSCDGC